MTTVPDPEREWWTTSDIAAYLGVQLGTVSSYRNRGQMPPPARQMGRSPVWSPAEIIAWHQSRPRPGVGGRVDGGSDSRTASDYWVVSTSTATRGAADHLARLAIESRCAVSTEITGPVSSGALQGDEFVTAEEWRLSFVVLSHSFDDLEELIRGQDLSRTSVITAHALTAMSPQPGSPGADESAKENAK